MALISLLYYTLHITWTRLLTSQKYRTGPLFDEWSESRPFSPPNAGTNHLEHTSTRFYRKIIPF